MTVPRSTDPQIRQATHDRLLRVAASEFAQVGFEQANINTIAERAGLGKGTIYLYFPSKQDLFLALLRAIAQRHLAAIHAALGGGNLQQQLEALVAAFVRLAAEDPDGFHVYMSALYGVNRAFQAEAVKLLQGYIALLRTALAQWPAYQRLEPARLEACALWLFSATESFVLAARVLGYSEQRLAALIPSIAQLLMSGLGGGMLPAGR
jgi:AcrR family transcriptional regulator